MPIPSPKKSEKKSDFISRCMRDSTMKKEHKEQDQRSAVCYNKWDNSKKKKGK